ncbi:MAG: 4'-phosphopantetheinyl transferase superfamily protein [Lachnospiraceae bacterium]|nr:4'-phosphopantetheinyl transferase superfamily protein [Lachnospiraceae bacterium]
MATVNVICKNVNFEQYEASFTELVEKVYPERKKAVLRLKNKKAAIMSLATGLLLQEIVEKECGISADELEISTNNNGKPYIVGRPDFYFNISHSSSMLVMAYGDCELGVDVEKLKENDITVAKRCFTKEEYEYIIGDISLDYHTKPEHRFCKIWTMKEAYLKYKGTGIAVPLNSFTVNPIEGKVSGEEVSIFSRIMDEYMLSICTSSQEEVQIKFS